MEAEERPTKIRKLGLESTGFVDTGDDLADQAPSTDKPEQLSQEQSTELQLGGIIESTAHKEPDSLSPKVSGLPPASLDQAPPQNLSKNQLKKIRKKEEWEAGRAERRATKKAKEKEKKQRKREEREQEAERRKANGEDQLPLPEKTPVRRGVCLPITFIIDCGFDDKMNDGERISLGSQVTRSYSDNHRALYQAHLVVSSWGGLLRERFETVLSSNHKSWKGIEFTERDFVAAAEQASDLMRGPQGGKLDGVFKHYNNPTSTTRSFTHGDSSIPEDPLPTTDSPTNTPAQDQQEEEPDQDSQSQGPSPLPTPETIYLTSDSPHTLTTLRPYSTYIIGGLVDKNRHKGICHRLARDRGVKTAKLPIAEFMEMQSRAVLATNHVVEIMVRWLECGDWGESFMRVIPARKGGRLRGGIGMSGKMNGGEEGKSAVGREEGDGDNDEDAVSVAGDGDGDRGGDDDEDEDSEVNIIDASITPTKNKERPRTIP